MSGIQSTMQMVTAAEMAAADKRTVDECGISFDTLMNNAGTAVARFVQRRYPHARTVAVLCGTGNNGGDGFVTARMLQQVGCAVSVYLLGTRDRLQDAAAAAFAALTELPVSVHEGDDLPVDWRQVLGAADLVVDAIVGTGFRPPLRAVAAGVRDALAGLAVPVVSVDLPSGWDADARVQTVEGACRSDGVVTFTAPKPAHLFAHLTSATFGPVVVAGIGSPASVVQSAERIGWTGTAKRLFEQPRAMDSNKGMYGHVLLIGGASGKPGAPSMASLAALRFGAGLVAAAVASSIQQTVALITPELMTVALEEDEQGGLSLANTSPEKLQKLLKRISVLAIGPGLGTDGDTPALVRRLVAETKLPLVLDADGLNAFHGRTDLLNGKGRTMVLTPHPGEMATLLGITTKQVQADRENLARNFAVEHSLTLVLKGWRTLVAHPDGSLAVNTTGNPAMAKGGSGDILTGIVAAALAQHPEPVAQAVNAAVYLHGLAGDLAAVQADEHTILATDTVAHLSDAFRYRTCDADGLEWLCGVRPAGEAVPLG